MRQVRGLGDAVHLVAQPVAVAVDHLAGTNLRNCAGCIGKGGRRDRWNKAVPFRRPPQQGADGDNR